MYKARAVNCPSPGVNDQVVSHTAAKETCITHHSLSRPYLTSVTANQIPVVEICKVVAVFAGHRCESSGARRGPKVRVQANPGVDQLAPHLLGSRLRYTHRLCHLYSNSLKTPASRTATPYYLPSLHPQRLCALLSATTFPIFARFATQIPSLSTHIQVA